MQNTVNLNLKKPDQNDFVNIGDINDNMDILDAEVAKKYVKPLAGIPSLDLDSATQAALKKAETALQTVTKSSVGLGNVDNTSDVNKPVSTAQQVALDKKANLASPSLTGTPTAPTAAESTNTQQIATTAFVDRAVKTHQADNVSHDTYVSCATASTTAEKVVTATGFTLVEGARITVKFANANTATVPTLKINAELAKPLVKADGTAFKNIKGGIYSFVYSGSNFTVQGEGGEYGNVTAADVRSTKTFGTEDGVVQGTLDLSNLTPENIQWGTTVGGVTGELTGKKLIRPLKPDSELSYEDNSNAELKTTYYTDAKKVTVNHSGMIRITYNLFLSGNGNTAYAGIFKNGIQMKEISNTVNYVEVKSVVDISVVTGDVITLRLKVVNTSGGSFNNLFQIGVTTVQIGPNVVTKGVV